MSWNIRRPSAHHYADTEALRQVYDMVIIQSFLESTCQQVEAAGIELRTRARNSVASG